MKESGRVSALDEVRLAMQSAQAAGLAAQDAMRVAARSVQSSTHSQPDYIREE